MAKGAAGSGGRGPVGRAARARLASTLRQIGQGRKAAGVLRGGGRAKKAKKTARRRGARR